MRSSGHPATPTALAERRLKLAAPASVSSISIRTLGNFEVTRGGEPVHPSRWQSKKSRDALKILIARRGRPLHRESLMDLLWPGTAPDQAEGRLSVALSRMRAVLDPDWTHPKDHFVRTIDDALALDLETVEVDVERFLRIATVGLRMARNGGRADAAPTLRAAYDLYAGDFLEEESFEEWTSATREEARASFLAIAEALGGLAVEHNDGEAAVGYFARVLAVDPYAEEAHLGLVKAALSASRHGEAQRLYLAYVARMNELDIQPAPMPRRGSPRIQWG